MNYLKKYGPSTILIVVIGAGLYWLYGLYQNQQANNSASNALAASSASYAYIADQLASDSALAQSVGQNVVTGAPPPVASTPSSAGQNAPSLTIINPSALPG